MDSENVTQFPAQPEQPPLLVGPFQEWRVVVDGRMIPRLTGYKYDDGRVSLSLDHRLGADFPSEQIARQAAWLIANALAIGEGYPSMIAPTKDKPFAPIGHALGDKP